MLDVGQQQSLISSRSALSPARRRLEGRQEVSRFGLGAGFRPAALHRAAGLVSRTREGKWQVLGAVLDGADRAVSITSPAVRKTNSRRPDVETTQGHPRIRALEHHRHG